MVFFRSRVRPWNDKREGLPPFPGLVIVGLIHELTLPLIRGVPIPPSPLDKGGDSFNFLATFLGEIALRVPLWNTVGVKE
jgi:hypothetical protein